MVQFFRLDHAQSIIISAAALWSESSARNSDSLPESSLRFTVGCALRGSSLVPPAGKDDQ